MARRDDLRGLLAYLRGDMPAAPDWTGVIALANKALCSPALAARLIESGQFSLLPTDVRTFLKDIHRRNKERNRRLLAQLDEAAAILNAIDVRPILLKGTAWLAAAEPTRRAARLLADIDLMVAPQHFFAVIDQLARIGYTLDHQALRTDVPVVLSRAQDAATIDLHSEYGSSGTVFYDHHRLTAGGTTVDLPGSRVNLPSSVDSIAILLLHDQLKGRDYLRGRIDLRHLLDIQDFAESFGDEEWRELDRLFANPYARDAMRTQLLTARNLLGIDIPGWLVRGMRARIQYGRRLFQLRWPQTAAALTLLSMLDPAYLSARRAFRRAKAKEAGRFLPRRTSMERLLVRNELGKI
ncbi:MAG TPA: nucleotidyltransferase family protein [Sphingobium sp.]|nr:nucleotidyltransferase family protein [Sphingobium sp.]